MFPHLLIFFRNFENVRYLFLKEHRTFGIIARKPHDLSKNVFLQHGADKICDIENFFFPRQLVGL